MYISLKWKAVVFFSLVFIAITTAWTWQIINKQLEAFELELEQTKVTREVLLSELVNDSFLRLSQFSELISGRQVVLRSIKHSGTNLTKLKQSLERDWLSYHINLGLDYLAIYDADNRVLNQVNTPDLDIDQNFRDAILTMLKNKHSSEEPGSLIYCNRSCVMMVLQPFISDEGSTGTIVLAQNMADIVRVFYNFSSAGLGILVDAKNNDEVKPDERYLANWNVYAWAVSDFNRIFPILKQYADFNSLNNDDPLELFSSASRHYQINSLQLPDTQMLGSRVLLISVEDKTSTYELVNSNIKRAFITGTFGLLAAEFILLLLIYRPMNKLVNITEALHLLPYQKFSQAIEKVEGNKSLFSDELTTLANSTVYVAGELGKLQKEINQKNISLEEQVHALTRSRAFLTRLFDNSQIFIITQDFEFNIQSTNMKFESLYDDTPSDFLSLIIDQEEIDEFREMSRKLITQKIDAFQHEFVLPDQHKRNVIITWTHTLVEDEMGNLVILSIGMDQTLQKKAENELRWMANHDGLTSIGNRRSFNTTFNELLQKHIPGVLIFIDVNRFKQINDIFGHNAGDQVLIDIANKLLHLTRATDTISRFAGDEFTILMTHVNHQDIPGVLQKLSTELNSSIQTGSGRSVQYSVSIGASLFPDQGHDPQELINNADMAMYNAKKKGMGHWHIFDSDDERVYQVKNDHNLILAIKHALKTSSFKLEYQPILDIKNNRISHFEVLIRMQDEKGQNISPAIFIPLAEKSGEIRHIDEWVLDRSLASLQDCSERGEGFAIAINISAPTLQADDFPELIFNSIAKYHIDPAQVIIELTETAYIENFNQVLRNLRLITKKGIRVALDDFGVGFSSFTYLKMLPLSYVKLDGSYIRNLTRNPDDQVFVKSLSAMINAFGMKIIAEFVEDQETLSMVEVLGVSHGQGYFIGKPAPLEKYHEVPDTTKPV